MSRRLALAGSMSFAIALTACGSSGGPADGGADGRGDANTDAADQGFDPGDLDAGEDLDLRADCAAFSSVPPIVTVVDAVNGSSICDPTFGVAGWPDAGPMPADDGGPILCSATRLFGCPDVTTDAAVGACNFALVGLAKGSVASYEVRVSRTGYQPVTVSVTSGVVGCVTPVAASHTKVELLRLSQDASAEGG